MQNFFTAQKLDASMKKVISDYIDKFCDIFVLDLLERAQFSGYYICPICKTSFRHHATLFDHYRYKKNHWELELLEKIYQNGPNNLPYLDAYYEKQGHDYILRRRIIFWVLCTKIYEHISPMPDWKYLTNRPTSEYLKKLIL
jgi:hypothetical protein